jgi:hypothetical protein
VIRSLLSLRMESQLFGDPDQPIVLPGNIFGGPNASIPNVVLDLSGQQNKTPTNSDDKTQEAGANSEVTIDIEISKQRPAVIRTDTGSRVVRLVSSKLSGPTSKLLSCMRSSLEISDAVLMSMSGYRKYLGPGEEVSSDIVGSVSNLRKTMIKYDEEEASLMGDPALPPTYSDHPEVVELFLFMHPIRQAATSVEALLVKVMEMQQRSPGWKLYLPSYPFSKAIQRTNAQVRHDRGGVTAGFYFHSQSKLARTMKGMANVYKPLPREVEQGAEDAVHEGMTRTETIGKYEEEEDLALDRASSKGRRLRFKAWTILHRLQGFETRFALKVAVVTSMLAVPAWLSQSRTWWNENESWWAVVMVSTSSPSLPPSC